MEKRTKAIEIMKKHGMEEMGRIIEQDTSEVEISYAGFFGKMPKNEAYEMMREIWKDNPEALFIVDGALVDVAGGVVAVF